MNSYTKRIPAALLAVCCVVTATKVDAREPADLFRTALDNESTAPSFVLVTVVSPNGESRREVAIPAPFLLGAIHREFHLAYGSVGRSKAREIALGQRDRVFQFKSSEAAKNVRPRYSEKQLAVARGRLKGMTNAEVLTGFRADSGPLHALYKNSSFAESAAMRDAIAHVLLERGLLVGHGCVVGALTVSE